MDMVGGGGGVAGTDGSVTGDYSSDNWSGAGGTQSSGGAYIYIGDASSTDRATFGQGSTAGMMHNSSGGGRWTLWWRRWWWVVRCWWWFRLHWRRNQWIYAKRCT